MPPASRPFYAEAASDRLAAHLSTPAGTWRCMCEGDPLFYGSFMHLYVRLRAIGSR